MPPSKIARASDRSFTPSKDKVSKKEISSSGQKRTPRNKLSELSSNSEESKASHKAPIIEMYGCIDGENTLRLTLEKLRQLDKEKVNPKNYLANNLNALDGYLELVGWSKGKYIPNSFYNSLFDNDLKIKRLALRGRGRWTTCHCPEERSKFGEQIDSTSKENTTFLEELYVFRTFRISSCALLNLISKSPNLKVLRFYGDLAKFDDSDDHHTVFESVRFLSTLEGVYWPWCDRKEYLPTLRTLVSRQEAIKTFYCDGETTCELISSEKLQDLKYLSLNLNETWNYHVPEGPTFDAIAHDTSLTTEEKTIRLIRKKEKTCRRLFRCLPNRIEKLVHLTQLDNLEALEIRTYEINFHEDEDDEEKNSKIIDQYETYQLKFWESVAKMRNLKYLAVYGAWDLDKVARELAKHGLQIEYFRTNLMPGSLMAGVRESIDGQQLTLNLIDSTRHLVKLAKLKSLYFSCYEMLADFLEDTQVALKDVSDLIWRIDCRVYVTKIVDDVLNQILRRGNQSGKRYLIKLVVEPEDLTKAKFYLETTQKFSTLETIKDKLRSLVQNECKLRFGRTNFKTISLWGIEQAGDRDQASYEQLKAAWTNYGQIFRPIDRFV